MNRTVLVIIQANVIAHLGIAILILWKQSMEAAPATQVAPSKLGWQGIDFLRFLHHGILNAYLLAGWEEFADHLFLLFSIERRCHLIHNAGKIWLKGLDCLADGIDVPYEDSGIPIVIASGKVLLVSTQFRA